ncbi:NADH-quinone oxidoreductase subunit A [Pontibacter sp. G13]|uniref:NADH-quinone oxidoreductase subunit A n=1 Tax=Pontibacter sp. G13 TaxID=3074898 RepID=UPI00288911DE|nr:NADH-quinone oxidoreductase subunit A [Pontibacter sp. G13]WNJ17228.1 NADH-quinone oxidoreductase subunit A [Pontibacter sp. G13]
MHLLSQTSPQISEFGILLLFIIGGILFVLIGLMANKLLAPNRPNSEKLAAYECGEDPIGDATIQFNGRFYLVGLVFLIFDVEILFLFPWLTVYAKAEWIREMPTWGVFALVEMCIFAGILILGLAWAWRQGDLDWVTPKPIASERINPVPDQRYEAVNRKYAS